LPCSLGLKICIVNSTDYYFSINFLDKSSVENLCRQGCPGFLATQYEVCMIVEDLMSKSVVTVELDDSLRMVKSIFDNVSFHHLLVVEDSGKLAGVISDRDLLRTLSPFIGTVVESNRDLATLNKRVHQIMTRKPIVLYAHEDISAAIEIFNTHGVSCIPIISADNRPIGILSWRDILGSIR